MLRDSYNAEAAERQPYFRGWTSDDARVEKARALVASWDAVMNRESTPAAIYMTWQRHADMEAVAKGSRDGNSGQPGSPYYANLPERWGRNEFFPPVVHATRRGGEDPPSSDACASAVRMGERCKEQH